MITPTQQHAPVVPASHVIVLFILWLACNVVYALASAAPHTSLDNQVSHAFSWPIFSACVVLAAYSLWKRPGKNIGFAAPAFGGAWVLIYPTVLIVGVLVFALRAGAFQHVDAYKWILINTLMAGFSEEVMFRGYLLHTLATRTKFLKAALLLSALFGSVHLLNYLTTGNLPGSALQAVMASFSGLLFVAIRVKTNSLWPAIVVHGLFDFCVLASLPAVTAGGGVSVVVGVVLGVTPIVFGVMGLIQARKRVVVERFLKTK